LERLAPRLSELSIPVIILHAPNDILVPYENVDFMLRHFPKEMVVDTVVLQGKNHFIPWNAQAEVREAILRLAHHIADGNEVAK
jgi:pimeloyl-ACP methyl ester carboxylesterase